MPLWCCGMPPTPSLRLPCMMRPFEKLYLSKSSHLSFTGNQSLSFRVPGPGPLLESTQIPPSPPKQHQVGRDQLPSLLRHLSSMGKERNFDILASFSAAGGRHIRMALACLRALGAEDWLVEVLCSGYLVPIHHLLPISGAGKSSLLVA